MSEIKLQQHPISAAFPAMSAEIVGAWKPSVELPITEEQMLGASWVAHATSQGSIVFAVLTPSHKHKGFIDYQVLHAASEDWFTSNKPVLPCLDGEFLGHCLKKLGVDPSLLEWQPSTWSPLDAPAAKAWWDEPCVYLLRAGPFIKIGKATGRPAMRVGQLQAGCPYPIVVIGHFSGGFKEESELHRRFAAYRTQGEWFREEGELAEYVSKFERAAA